MPDLAALAGGHQLLAWLALAALLLIVELASGSGWLLWPAGAATIMAGVASFWPLGLAAQAAAFAALAVAATYAGRRWLARRSARGPDPNDPHARLVGREGRAVAAFERGRGRVFVDGKEWAAESEAGDGAPIPAGARVKVVALDSGACVRVRIA